MYKRRLQTFLIILYRRLFFTCYPGCLRNQYVRSPVCILWSTRKLCFVSTLYKKHYLWSSNMASKLWNSLPDSFERLTLLISIQLKWYYDQKNHFLFSSDFESVFP